MNLRIKSEKQPPNILPVKPRFTPILLIVLSFFLTITLCTPLFTAADKTEGGTFLQWFKESTRILPNTEIRALWVVRHALTSKDNIDRMIDLAVRGRFHMLFVQVRGRGDAYYLSSIEPSAEELVLPPDSFDPLAYTILRAHGEGIAVHAWVNVFYIWSDGGSAPPDGHIAVEHPEWLLTDAEGRRMDSYGLDELKSRGIEGYFISPAVREAREYTCRVIGELTSRYEIDGIHMDYVRYPDISYGYDVKERTKFALRYGVDPVMLLNDHGGIADIIGEESAGILDNRLARWRADRVDSMVLAVRETVSLPLSAAVIPNPAKALREKGQDWTGWVQRGWLDFAVIMAYNYKPGPLAAQVRSLDNIIGHDRLLAGLPLFGGRVRYLADSVELLRSQNIAGFSLFSYQQLLENPYSLGFIQRVFQTGE